MSFEVFTDSFLEGKGKSMQKLFFMFGLALVLLSVGACEQSTTASSGMRDVNDDVKAVDSDGGGDLSETDSPSHNETSETSSYPDAASPSSTSRTTSAVGRERTGLVIIPG